MSSHSTACAAVADESGSSGTEYCRPVERMVVHGAPLSFRALCERAVPTTTRYLVLDLDRTVHFGRNMGELLGWEIGAYRTYGAAHLARVEGQRSPGRFLLDQSMPLALARYLARGARIWAYPGLFYLFCGKLARRTETTRRWQYHGFGQDPHLQIQTIPSIALLHELSRLPVATLRLLSDRVFARHEADQVISRADIQWLRQRCPGVKILLSSASPQPVVQAAGRALGIDDVDATELEVHEGRVSAPFQQNPLYLQPLVPHRISPPSKSRINAGYRKIERLLERYPNALDPGVESVGISDTSHGEDYCWAQHLTRVIDINSATPYPPLLAPDSRCREIHSAQVLTHRELAARDRGDSSELGGRRISVASERPFDATSLSAQLVAEMTKVARLCERRERVVRDVQPALDELEAAATTILDKIEAVVHDYNDANGRSRRQALRQLHRHLRAAGSLERKRLAAERPLSAIAYELARTQRESRSRIA